MTLILTIDPDASLVMGALESTDDIGKIMRCHFVIEQMLEQLIAMHSTAVVDKKTSFWGKVNLARALGIPASICDACNLLNDLRNEFAHNPKATINNTKSISNKFIAKVGEIMPAVLISNGEFHNRESKTTKSLSFAKATQGEKIVVSTSFLSGLMGGLPSLYKLGAPHKLATIAGVNLP